ncbi:MAG: helix-turn-helix domain protein [Caulobacteraceae bacterium]|nr:helix-turn-helix domain protein [Caulobacteraceae bacterium]
MYGFVRYAVEMTEADLPSAESRALAERVREEMARRRLSREALAHLARISLSTLEKALSGARPFTLATVVRLETALGVSLRPAAAEAVAPTIELGGYGRAAVQSLEGDYLTLRPSFETPGALFAYRTQIAWSDAQACLTFCETARLDAEFAQAGLVAAPLASGHIYLHTNVAGQMRLAILSRPRRGGEMYGILTTLAAGRGAQLTPIASPIALTPFEAGAPLGIIGSDHPSHPDYERHLARARDGFARLIG